MTDLKTVAIDSLAHDGRGVAHVSGKAVFIPGALPGEHVVIGRRRRHRSYDEAVLESVESASASRVTPKCAHFGICGGCSLQHMDAATQIEFKQKHLLEQLERIGRVRPERVLPRLAGEPWNYRRRARLGAKFVPKKGRTLVGFRERAMPFIAELKRCEILAAPLDGLIEPLSQLLTSLSIRDRVPQIEVAVADNATALVFRVLDPPAAADLEQFSRFGARHGVQLYLQSGGADTIEPLEDSLTPAPLPEGEGEKRTERLFYRLPEFDVELEFQPADFIQINAALNRRMVALALELLQPAPQDSVLDLFCGLGNFSLPLARVAANVVGIEGEASLVSRAQHNARHNGLANVKFFAADLFQEHADASWARERYQRVLIDPPRAGAREVLPLIGRSQAQRLVYISCHPGSLARDAGILVHELGFRLEAAGALDMFPHTAHVESMAVFVR